MAAGDGNDRITGGAGDDLFVFNAGDGDDTITDFNFGNTGTLNDGDIENNDYIDLSTYYTDITELRTDFTDDGKLNQSVGDFSDNTAMAGGDALSFSGASASSFTWENTGVVCFAKGTKIATPRGKVPVEALCPGETVLTQAGGPQPILWIGRRQLTQAELQQAPGLRPIKLSPALTGGAAPLLVSPQHAVLLRLDGALRLVRATHLARLGKGIARIAQSKRSVTYYHILLPSHQILTANGAPAESFYPGPQAMDLLRPRDRATIQRMFPRIAALGAQQGYGPVSHPIAQRSHVRLSALQPAQ